jgi:hypothetical protein
MDEEDFLRIMKRIVPLFMSLVMAVILTFFLGNFRLFPSNFLSIYISVVILTVVTLISLFMFRFFDRVKERTTDKEYLESIIEDLNDKIKKEKKKNKINESKLESIKSGNLAAYTEIYSLENNLRKFIEKNMIKRWGTGWNNKIPPDIRIQCNNYKKKAKKASKLHHYDKSLSILSYSGLHELGLIIKDNNNWDNVFKPLFPREDSSIIIGHIETLVPFRDELSHMREITSKDLSIIKNTCKLVNDLISN